MLNNTFGFNQPIVLTYDDILSQYADGLITALLISSFMFLILSFYVVHLTGNWKLKTWTEVLISPEQNRDEIKVKVLRLFGWVCFPASLYFTLMLIAYKIGVVI